MWCDAGSNPMQALKIGAVGGSDYAIRRLYVLDVNLQMKLQVGPAECRLGERDRNQGNSGLARTVSVKNNGTVSSGPTPPREQLQKATNSVRRSSNLGVRLTLEGLCGITS